MGKTESAHTLIVGQTMTGKTTVAKEMCEIYARCRIPLCVLDPYNSQWPTGNIFREADAFMDYLQEDALSHLFVVDECRVSLARDKRYSWLASASRHRGHLGLFLAQRYSDVDPTIRDNCAQLILFNCSADYAREAAREYNDSGILAAADLPKGHYLLKRRHAPLVRGAVWWALKN